MEDNKRNLDGIYFRIKRNGKWDNVCFSDLTQDEREEVMKNKDVDWLKSMCIQLTRTIRKIGDEFDLIVEWMPHFIGKMELYLVRTTSD